MTVRQGDIVFVDNPAISERKENYVDIQVNATNIVENWRISLFSYEWILSDGRIKSRDELSESERTKRESVEACLSSGKPLEKPVLGIGMLDNVEIGIGRATFLTLVAQGYETIPVHIAKSHEEEFRIFLA